MRSDNESNNSNSDLLVDDSLLLKKKSSGSKTMLFSLLAIFLAVFLIITFTFFRLSNNNTSKNEITLGAYLAPTNLDIRQTSGAALEQVLLDNVYEGLLSVNDNYEITPSLASSWQRSNDGLSYIFELNDNLSFSDGTKFDAEDVVKSLQKTADNESNYAYKQFMNVKNISAKDANTVQIDMKQVDNEFIWHLANRAGIVYNETKAKNIKSVSAGSGPYRVSEWVPGNRLVLEINDNYWSTKAKTSKINIRYFSDDNAAYNAYKKGDTQAQISVVSDSLAKYENIEDSQILKSNSTDVFTLAYNSAKEPFNNKEFRKALNKAINTDEIITAVKGNGLLLGGPITKFEPGYEDLTDINSYNKAEAEKIINELAITDKTFTLSVPNIYPIILSDVLRSQFAEIGINLEIEQLDFSAWLDQVYTKHDYDISLVNHVEPKSVANYANSEYYFGYDSKEVQQFYADANSLSNDSKAEESLKLMAKQVAEDAPAKWLYNYLVPNAVSKDINGFPKGNVNARLKLSDLEIK